MSARLPPVHRARSAPPRALLLVLLLALVSGGCAWSNRANRPVWNAFEEHLVPQDATAFYATLPLTLPAGLVCILLDSLIVHPAQVVGDAWQDAGDVWKSVDWRSQYYTELVVLPFRVIGTPVVFVCMFLARSCFDLPPHGEQRSGPATEARAGPIDAQGPGSSAAGLLESLRRMARAAPDDPDVNFFGLAAPRRWTEELDAAYDEALRLGRSGDRLDLYLFAADNRLPPWRADPVRGLRDADAAVRYALLERWPADVEVPPGVRDALRADSNSAVRRLARQRWP